MLRSVTDIRSPLPGTTPPRGGQIKPLTAVRAFAALHVACYHMVHPFSRWGPLRNIISAGYTGVSFFFLLSGFILTYTYAEDFQHARMPKRRFWIARFARVYPLYLLSVLFAGLVYWREFRPLYHSIAFVADVLMLQSWSVRIAPFFNNPGWSLCVEAFFYALFPWIVLRLRPSTLGNAVWLIVAMWLLAMAVPLIEAIAYPHQAWSESSGGNYAVYATRRYPFFALPEFAAGVALGWLHLRFRLTTAAAHTVLAAGLAGTLLTLLCSPALPLIMLHNGLLIPFFAMIILGLCYPGPVAKLLSWKPLLLLGEASFALYLFHFPYNDLAQHFFHMPESLLGLVWRLLVLIPLSIALHLFVERPGRRFLLSRSWAAPAT